MEGRASSRPRDFCNQFRNKQTQNLRLSGKTASPGSFVAFGELLLRLDTKGFERFVQAQEFGARYTGGEANVAVALAHWGVTTFAVSKVPAHEIGQACINYLRRYGVNTDWVARGGERLGILYVETGAAPRPSKVIYDRAQTSLRGIQSGELDWNAILRGKSWLHITGTAPALGPNVLAVLKKGLRTAERLGVTVSFDSNYRSTLWSIADARRILPGLMDSVDIFLGTHHDARVLFDINAEPSVSAGEMRRRFGFSHVAYTLRQSPAAGINRLAGLLHDGANCCISREYEMQMVDRIGGGDAFSAGVIYGLMSKWDTQRTVEFAAAASCLKHTIPGDFNLVALSEVEQVMASENGGRINR